MKALIISALALSLAGSAYALDTATAPEAAPSPLLKPAAPAVKPMKPGAVKKAAAQALPLTAQLVKMDANSLTVMTQPMMGPDGLIPAKEKTYDTTNATVVVINAQTKSLTDLVAGSPVRLMLSDDGKTATHIESQNLTPADKAAKKAAKTAAVAADPNAAPAPKQLKRTLP